MTTGHQFTLSAFGDEIAADLAEQLDVMQQEGIPALEFRAAWGTNILDLSDDQVRQAKGLLDDAADARLRHRLADWQGEDHRRLRRALAALPPRARRGGDAGRAAHPHLLLLHPGGRGCRAVPHGGDGPAADAHPTRRGGGRHALAREREGDLRRHRHPLRRHPHDDPLAASARRLRSRELHPVRRPPDGRGVAALGRCLDPYPHQGRGAGGRPCRPGGRGRRAGEGALAGT